MPILEINGQPVEVEEGRTLLQAAQEAGIKVPTLCYHPALSAYGACRLCVVEVHTDGRSSVQASCSYPALDGLKIYTETERVLRARRIAAELLLARCPDSEVIRRIAGELGVAEPRISKKDEDCIYCGLCVRVCQERMGRSAVTFSYRGSRRRVEPPFRRKNPVCWTCGACNYVCPVGRKVAELTSPQELKPLPNPHNLGLDSRGSVFILYPQTVPNVPIIDRDSCVHLRFDACGICSEVCPAKAIDYDQKDETIELDVGAVLVAPGFKPFEATEKAEELGYGRYPNVVTALEFERILSASGCYQGHVLRPSDLTEPRRIAFLQCVGSREAKRDYCSSVCCMFATKEAIIAKEHVGDHLQCDIYYMDLRAFSKGFEEYYNRAKHLGIRYIWSRVPLIREVPETRNLVLEYLGEGDRRCSAEYDMVVLSVGMEPPENIRELAEKFGIELGDFDFCKTSVFNPVASSKPGVYLAGPFTEPKDIPETVTQASAAVSRILSLLKDVRFTLISPTEYPPEIDVRGQEPRIGVFICHCGTNIAGVVNVPETVEYAKGLPNVVYAENNLYTCSVDAQERIKEKIKEHGLNRVVVASCTPRTHELLFRNTIREAGLNKYLFEMANIRDQCSWVHMHEPRRATAKAKDLVRMAVAKARLLEPLEESWVPVAKSGLVIGGGLSGMTAALSLAEQGYRVYLLEKSDRLGGNLTRVRYLLNGEDPEENLRAIVERVESHPEIRVFKEAEIVEAEGSVGNFKTMVRVEGGVEEIEHGVVVVATGAEEYRPSEYLYEQDERVVTQRELEEALAEARHPANGKTPPETVVMIQCVGSRDEERPYCSRICCVEAVKNALKIKELWPSTNVYTLYRDMRTYGLKEGYYTKARQKGVVFMRYGEEAKPEVVRDGSRLVVRVFEKTVGETLEIPADLVVLSTGVVPSEGNKDVSQHFKIPLTKEGFFLEAHMKLRPVDFATDGVFLCGLAHAPKLIEESIVQAEAAAARAGIILAKDKIELEATRSQVIDENCDGCAYCVEPCPFQAITLLEYVWQEATKKTVEVNESLCKGCGTCMATCPKRGVIVRGFSLAQLEAQVEAALEALVEG